MKRIWIGLAALAAMGTMAQEQATQSGTPALLEAANGKKARVFLQRLEDGKLTFQPYKSTKDYTVPATKVNRLTFYPKYDAEAVEQQFNSGDYSAVISSIGSMMEPFWEYMVVDNNLRDAFCMLMDAHRKLGEFSEVRKAANILQETDDPKLVQRGQVNVALTAIADHDLETAKKIRDEVASEAAGLYLQASIERAEQRPTDAIKTVSGIIIDHANDVEWLGPSELLCAYLYVDMLGTNSVITTNSALHTARQVKNMYRGTHVAADAEKLWTSLGGADLEAAVAAERAEWKAKEKADREKREAEEKVKREAEEKEKKEAEEKARREAEAAAQAEDAASTNVTTTTEMESE